MIEGNHYFPSDSINWSYFTESAKTTACHWKGEANYYSIKVGEKTINDVAWVYKNPLEKAAEIKGFVAFYPSVTVET